MLFLCFLCGDRFRTRFLVCFMFCVDGRGVGSCGLAIDVMLVGLVI